MKTYTIISNNSNLCKLKLSTQSIPSPNKGEVLVNWKATSLNYHDYLVVMGLIQVEEDRVPMSDGAGEIVEIGEGVTEWKVGDKIMSLFFPNWTSSTPTLETIRSIPGESIDGYMCAFSCMKEDQITRMPINFNFFQAATLPCAGLTAWNALMHGCKQLLPHHKVLIEGTGGMSLWALKIAMAYNVDLYATTSSKEKANKLLDLGVTKVFDYKEDVNWGKTIFKQTGGMDHILDVGGGSTMIQSIEAAKIGGNITSIGILGNGRKGMITFPKLFFKFINIRGIAVGSRAMQMDLIKAVETLNIFPVIDKVFDFDNLQAAFEYQSSGKHFGKIVVKI
ncbi:MAG: NAD(P)-dependent alcohol dehydrogenase [Saprospiraceae bacterium]